MTNDVIEKLLEYGIRLEKVLQGSNPEQFQELIRKREELLPLLQEQRALLEALRTAHKDDQKEIDGLRSEIDALRSGSRAVKAERQGRPDIDRKSRK